MPQLDTDLGGGQDSNTLRTQMESGTYRQRRRYTAERLAMRATWTLDDTEFAVFVAIHKWKLNLGNDWFQMDIPLGGGILPHVVRFVDGKFDQNYDDVQYWRVGAVLEIQERAVISEAALDLYLELGFSEDALTNIISAIDGFHECLHQTLPSNLNLA